MVKPVTQEETTGAMGLHGEGPFRWSDTQLVRKMLSTAGVETSADEIPFVSWSALPDLALLSIRHHEEDYKNFQHWVGSSFTCKAAY